MKHHNMPLRDAYMHTLQRRPEINPNDGFMDLLIDYEKELFGSSTWSRRDMQLLDLQRQFPKMSAGFIEKCFREKDNDVERARMYLFRLNMTGKYQ
jgi:flavodoxin